MLALLPTVVSEDELRTYLEHGRKLVRLQDGTYAPVDPEKVGDILGRMAEIYATSGQQKKLPLSQAGRINDLLQLVSDVKVAAPAKTLFERLEDVGEERRLEIDTPNGYDLTVTAALGIVQRLLGAELPGGYYTPAMLMGADYVLSLPGVKAVGAPSGATPSRENRLGGGRA